MSTHQAAAAHISPGVSTLRGSSLPLASAGRWKHGSWQHGHTSPARSSDQLDHLPADAGVLLACTPPAHAHEHVLRKCIVGKECDMRYYLDVFQTKLQEFMRGRSFRRQYK